MGQIVDTDSAKEFMRETLEKVEPQELFDICSEVEMKSRLFREKLSLEALPKISSEEYFVLLRRMFSTRRRAQAILKEYALDDLRQWTQELIHGADPVDVRFQLFNERLAAQPESVRRDWASELLHFSNPERHWLWTRWMWDPKVRTGALPLVTFQACDLEGATDAEIYVKVGQAVAFVNQVGEAAGIHPVSKATFGTDVFLACVYVVYVYTVLRLRMTQEFNKVMPGLPEFVRRLLGVYENGGRAFPIAEGNETVA